MILVSACLLGVNCKYNGKSNYNKKLYEKLKHKNILPICPEQLGGLTTPRTPAEIKYINNKKLVITQDNIDVTSAFEKGANEVLELAKKFNIKEAILQTRSPSCGYGKIYNGNFEKKLIDGHGILAELLINNGIKVTSSDKYI